MAKQHVSFVERHVEKLIIGVTGAVFLAVAFLFGINTPNIVTLPGAAEPLTAGELYPEIGRMAESLQGRMKIAEPDAFEDDPAISSENQPGGPKPTVKPVVLPREIVGVFVSSSPKVPDRPDEVPFDGVKLAAILAPSRPALATGKVFGQIPDPIVRHVQADRASIVDQERPMFSRGHHWVLISAAIDRKRQRAEFAKNKYLFAQQRVIVADIEVQRQELLPNARWGKPEIITPYRADPVAGVRPTVNVLKMGQTFDVSAEDKTYIHTYRQMLDGGESQKSALRPMFQEFLVDKGARWKPPVPPGQKIDWQEFEVVLYSDKPTVEGSIRGGPPGRGGVSANRQANLDFAHAQKLLEEDKTVLEAKDILQGLAGMVNADGKATPVARQAKDLLDDELERFERVFNAEIDKEQQREASQTVFLGPDIDPLWVNDLSVEPGKTYRYRLRLVAFNQYAGLTTMVKPPQDAGKVLLRGSWSEWSDEITASPAQRVFFMGAGKTPDTALFELYRWQKGKWERLSGEVPVGARVALERREETVAYDGIVMALERDRPCQARKHRSKQNGPVTYADGTSDRVTLVNTQGQAEVRYQLTDKQRLSEFRSNKSREEKLDRMSARAAPGMRGSRFPPGGRFPPAGGRHGAAAPLGLEGAGAGARHGASRHGGGGK